MSRSTMAVTWDMKRITVQWWAIQVQVVIIHPWVPLDICFRVMWAAGQARWHAAEPYHVQSHHRMWLWWLLDRNHRYHRRYLHHLLRLLGRYPATRTLMVIHCRLSLPRQPIPILMVILSEDRQYSALVRCVENIVPYRGTRLSSWQKEPPGSNIHLDLWLSNHGIFLRIFGLRSSFSTSHWAICQFDIVRERETEFFLMKLCDHKEFCVGASTTFSYTLSSLNIKESNGSM